jgi:CNT family concentrative nucleoside transporter
MLLQFFQPLLGFVFFLSFAWFFSDSKSDIPYKKILKVFLFYIVFVYVLTQTSFPNGIFAGLDTVFRCVRSALVAGTSFVFGPLGGDGFFLVKNGQAPFVLAIQTLPMIVFVSSLSMLLFHWKVISFFSAIFEKIVGYFLGLNKTMSLFCSLKMFFCYIEATLFIKNYLHKISKNNLFLVFTLGMATTSMSVIIVYDTLLGGIIDHPIRHIIISTLMSIPISVIMALLIVPPSPDEHEKDMAMNEPLMVFQSSFQAIAKGTVEGGRIYANVVLSLIVMVALVALFDQILAFLPPIQGAPLTCSRILGTALCWVTWLFGIPWSESFQAAQFLGARIAQNEIIAYSQLAQSTLSPRTLGIMVYALCSFANFSTIGITVTAFANICPQHHSFLTSHISRAFLAALLVSCVNACTIGFISFLDPLFFTP